MYIDWHEDKLSIWILTVGAVSRPIIYLTVRIANKTCFEILKTEVKDCIHLTQPLMENVREIFYPGVSLDGITRSVHGKFNCITDNFEKSQHDTDKLFLTLSDQWNSPEWDSNVGPKWTDSLLELGILVS